MVILEKFISKDFDRLISWVKSAEELMQFGGPAFSFPLTHQQLESSISDPQRHAFKLIDVASRVYFGHAEVYMGDESIRFGRILIGDARFRGKGYCRSIVDELVKFSLSQNAQLPINLNVFDWNTPAIKCYEKAGFFVNPDKKLERTVNGKTWIALNMILDVNKWNEQITKTFKL